MDPRLKLDFYKDDRRSSAEDPEEIMSYVKSFYNRDYAPSNDTISSKSSSAKKKCFLQGYYKESNSSSNVSEFDLYISEPVVENHSNFQVLEYWKLNAYRFPHLSRMARDYLAVPGTSTPSERAFSGGRQLITDFRCSLSAETIAACMLLKNWQKKCYMIERVGVNSNF